MFYLRDAAIFALFLVVITLSAREVWRRADALSRLEAWALVCALTVGISGLLIWICGSAFGVGKSLAACLLVVPMACVVWSRRTAKSCTSSTRIERLSVRETWRAFAFDEKLLALYAFVVCALTFALCLAPPNGGDYDSLVYHLAAPAQYIRAGQIIELPYDHHTYFPFTLEMLYMIGLLWSGPVLAKLFHWLMLPLICALLIGTSTRYVTRRAGLAASAIWCSLPLVMWEASTAYIDLALVAFTLGALWCFFRWSEGTSSTRCEMQTPRDARWLWLCGAMCGFCLGVKYTGVVTVFWLLCAIVFVMLRARKIEAKPILAFVGVTLLLGGGWYGRNALWTGNPVFPFAYEVFGGEGWTAEMARRYTQEQQILGFGKAPVDILLLPWRLSMTPLSVGVDSNGLAGGQPFWPLLGGLANNNQTGLFEVRGLLLVSFIGPILLALGAPLLFARQKPSWIRFCGWNVLYFGVVWIVSTQTFRYGLPLFMLICVVCGYGFALFGTRSSVLRWTANLALCAWLLWSAAFSNYAARNAWNVVAGKRTPESYLAATVAPYRIMQWMNLHLPLNAVVAVYAEPRCFYLQRAYFWADPYQNTLFPADGSPDALLDALKSRGATHVLLNRGAVRNFGVGGAPPQFAAIAPEKLKVLRETPNYIVFEIVR